MFVISVNFWGIQSLVGRQKKEDGIIKVSSAAAPKRGILMRLSRLEELALDVDYSSLMMLP